MVLQRYVKIVAGHNRLYVCGIIDNLMEGQSRKQKQRMTQILTWKPELGKTTWSPQTPKQNTMMKRSTMRNSHAATSRSPSSQTAMESCTPTLFLTISLLHGQRLVLHYLTKDSSYILKFSLSPYKARLKVVAESNRTLL